MPNFNPATLTVEGKRKSFAVPGVSSLYLRVSETGTKTWILKYKAGSAQRKYTIGRYPELSLPVAKKEALRIRGSVSLGHDPQAERREDRKALTVKAMAAMYLEKHSKIRKKTWKCDERSLSRDVIPHIGNLTKVTRPDESIGFATKWPRPSALCRRHSRQHRRRRASSCRRIRRVWQSRDRARSARRYDPRLRRRG